MKTINPKIKKFNRKHEKKKTIPRDIKLFKTSDKKEI